MDDTGEASSWFDIRKETTSKNSDDPVEKLEKLLEVGACAGLLRYGWLGRRLPIGLGRFGNML